jgi:hypothetical protein
MGTPRDGFLEKRRKPIVSTFRIPDELRKEFKLWCVKNDMSMQKALVHLIRQAVNREKSKDNKRQEPPKVKPLPTPMDWRGRASEDNSRVTSGLEPLGTDDSPPDDEPEVIQPKRPSTAVKIR